MRLLLDTHAFLWFATSDRRLSTAAAAMIEDEANQSFLSIASAWELTIKQSIGKLTLTQPIEDLLGDAVKLHGINLLHIELTHVICTGTLPFHHRDPFDRLLIAQSMSEGIPLVSADPFFDSYGIERIW